MSYKLNWTNRKNYGVAVIGCGGTGGFVAEGLCRLLPKETYDIWLVDHDKVEEHNLIRQNFFHADLGKFKSQTLAERLSRLYGRQIYYSVNPYTGSSLRGSTRVDIPLIIGCVDNAGTRKAISQNELNEDRRAWWIDAGNGKHSGQVLIGNARSKAHVEKSFEANTEIVHALPSPGMQLPSLLIPVNQPVQDNRDCAEIVRDNEQSPVINQMMATLVLQMVYQLINKQLIWMAAYLDLETGSLSSVPADPGIVAQMTKMNVNKLIYGFPRL